MKQNGIWSEGSASIILLPSGENGERVLSLAREWTQTGMLRPAMWLDLDKVTLIENAPPHVPVVVLGLAPDRELHEIEVDLFSQLAQHELSIVRIVALRYLTEDRSTHLRQNTLVRDVGYYLERSLPLPVNQTGKKEAKTRYFRLNVVVHPTQLTGLQQDQVIEGSWEANLIVSPEDRRSPWTSDAFVREGDQLDAFALAHIATAAGLWNGLPNGAYDGVATGEGQSGKIIVPRLFVRAVSSDGLARRVSTKVLREFSDSSKSTRAGSLSFSIPGTRGIQEDQINDYKNWILANIFQLDNSRLQYQGISAIPPLPKARILEFVQIKHFFSFAGNKVSQIPKWTWQAIRASFGRRLTRKLQGDDGLATVGIEIDANPDERDEVLIKRITKINEQLLQLDLDPSLIALEKVSAESSPALWSGMRKLFFGMLDGSELPQKVETPMYENDKLVFERVSDLVFNPEQIWESKSGKNNNETQRVPISDPQEVANAHVELDETVRKARARFSKLTSELLEVKRDYKTSARELEQVSGTVN
jgi:hypothetical protein